MKIQVNFKLKSLGIGRIGPLGSKYMQITHSDRI